MALKYKRILLKLSGEVLKGASDACHDEAILADVAKRLAELVALGAEVGVVIGGGNIFRGLTGARNGTDRVLGCWRRSSTRWPCRTPSSASACRP